MTDRPLWAYLISMLDGLSRHYPCLAPRHPSSLAVAFAASMLATLAICPTSATSSLGCVAATG